MLVAAADTGGTFTDVLLYDGSSLRAVKVPSTPDDPGRAVQEGLQSLLGGEEAEDLVHGTTVATNALLERKGARTALLTTAGFEDLLAVGRQDRRGLYALMPQAAVPVVEGALRFGLSERTLHDGTVEKEVDAEEVEAALEEILDRGGESVAVGLLHSWADPTNERTVLEAVRARGIPCCASHELLREYREYERFTTVTLNAYLLPRMEGYLRGLERETPCRRLRVMQSDGGTASGERAAREPVRALYSGPAGGVVGAFDAAARSGFEEVLTLDMGGTSTDVALCPGRVERRGDCEIDGIPVRTPVLDLHTVGAGGGSVAYADEGGALRVGPASAGADPGPCCYGRGGTRPTVTDANLLLGLFDAERPLGEGLRLTQEAARQALDALAGELDLDREEVCLGIRRVVNAAMERALRVISVERGHDPRGMTLVAFGGAGPLHAADLADALGIRRVLVPPRPGVLSALGMLLSDLAVTRSRSLLAPLEGEDGGRPLREALEALRAEVHGELAAEGTAEDGLQHRAEVSLRYRGQSWELDLPVEEAEGASLRERFHELHERRYGYREDERGVELVTVRLRARVAREPLELPPPEQGSGSAHEEGRTEVVVAGARGPVRQSVARYDRDRLLPGMELSVPAVVHEATSTTWVPSGWKARVETHGGILLDRGPEVAS